MPYGSLLAAVAERATAADLLDLDAALEFDPSDRIDLHYFAQDIRDRREGVPPRRPTRRTFWRGDD